MDALRSYLVTQPSMGFGNRRRRRAGLAFAGTTEEAMGKDSLPLPHRAWGLRSPHPPGVGQTLAVGLLAATLAITAALPAFAQGTPRQGHRADQRQEQAISSEARSKGKKTRTVRKTLANGDAIAIPRAGSDALGPGSPYPSSIQVGGFKRAKVLDVNLVLHDLTHDFPADVAVMLVAPGGRNAIVMADVGNPPTADEAVTDITLTLDDEAAASLPLTELLTTGSFRPTDGATPGPDGEIVSFPAPAPGFSGNTALSTFDGINPNGQWQVFVLDDDGSDIGALEGGWSLQITAKAKAKKKQ